MGEAFSKVHEKLEQGELPACCASSSGVSGEIRLIDDRKNFCGECPVAKLNPGDHAICISLTHGEIDYGCLVVAIEGGIEVDEEELVLFREMADDLAFALSVLQMEQDREKTEQKAANLENQLFQSQKMESIGRLAGGVAHDFNNMLSVIIGYSEMALAAIRPEDTLHAEISEILNAARRSAEITSQLLAFARRQTISPRVLDLNETVETMLRMLRQLIGEDKDLTWIPGKKLWPVRMDPGQISQILANLCVNSRDAIDGVGNITIETDNRIIDKDYCEENPGFLPGEYVLLAVSDNGRGIDKEILANVFEPFFTTKENHQGTGLGLATVYGVIKQNDGFINVYSEPEKGTTFRIYIPRHLGEIERTAPLDEGKIPEAEGETIILVEDEPQIMKVTSSMLEKLGYRVLATSSPGEAVTLAKEYPDPIDLLLTDLIMPEMNGKDLSIELSSLRPGLKTLFMSGYTANVIAHHGILDKGVNFLQKPFSMKEISARVRQALANKDSTAD